MKLIDRILRFFFGPPQLRPRCAACQDLISPATGGYVGSNGDLFCDIRCCPTKFRGPHPARIRIEKAVKGHEADDAIVARYINTQCRDPRCLCGDPSHYEVPRRGAIRTQANRWSASRTPASSSRLRNL